MPIYKFFLSKANCLNSTKSCCIQSRYPLNILFHLMFQLVPSCVFVTKALGTDEPMDGPTNGRTDGRTDRRTEPLIEIPNSRTFETKVCCKTWDWVFITHVYEFYGGGYQTIYPALSPSSSSSAERVHEKVHGKPVGCKATAKGRYCNMKRPTVAHQGKDDSGEDCTICYTPFLGVMVYVVRGSEPIEPSHSLTRIDACGFLFYLSCFCRDSAM